jgi:alkane 1-monooxygenase
MRSLRFQLVQIFPTAFLVFCAARKDWGLSLSGLFFLLGIPLLDLVIGKTTSSVPERLDSFDTTIARLAPLIFVALYIASVVSALSYIRYSHRALVVTSCVISVGTCAGLAFSAAHELIHMQTIVSRQVARLCLVVLCFGHFEIEHLYSHHRFAGTKHDTSSARPGESIYSFLARSIPSGISFALSFERSRLIRQTGRPKPSIFGNRVLCGFALSAIATLLVCSVFGSLAALFFVLQASVGILLLMTTAYIQHYGLVREDSSHFRAHHGWDSHYRLSNWINFDVQHHASHHIAPTRLFVRHQSYAETPELPAGYPAMIVLAMVPPIWNRVMNQRIELTGRAFQHG